MQQGLRNEHAVEGIAVRAAQSSGPCCIGDADRQLFEALADDCAAYIPGQRAGFGKFAESVLGGYFPGGRRADEDIVFLGASCEKRCSAEFLPQATGRGMVSGRDAAFAGW